MYNDDFFDKTLAESNTKDKLDLIEEIFSSRGRTRVLVILAKNLELNVSEIVRRSKLNFTNVRKHLKFFIKINLVKEKKFGRIRIYEFNEDNPIGRAIKSLVDIFQEA
ncbi:MAG: winged helix-turn-helix domain-containing protein [Candidatus Asgardarchaeia archaeon]